ncbi:MAG: hypothetical protein ABI867_32700 [Kofleriaceae bacterium]
MTKSVGDHRYTESGLDNVILRNVTKHTCESCGAQRVLIPGMTKMHHAIAKAIAEKPARLSPAEVGFLRDHLELSNREFADLMGVTQEQTSRWTGSEPIGVPAERFLRMMAILGPGGVAKHKAEGLDSPESPADFYDSVKKVLEKLPARSEPVRDIDIGLKRSGATDWIADQTVN